MRTKKKEATRKASAKRRVAVALASYLKKVNPAVKLAGARVEKLKGGVLKIPPIKANRGAIGNGSTSHLACRDSSRTAQARPMPPVHEPGMCALGDAR